MATQQLSYRVLSRRNPLFSSASILTNASFGLVSVKRVSQPWVLAVVSSLRSLWAGSEFWEQKSIALNSLEMSFWARVHWKQRSGGLSLWRRRRRCLEEKKVNKRRKRKYKGEAVAKGQGATVLVEGMLGFRFEGEEGGERRRERHDLKRKKSWRR
ncbi:hypothetical protein CCACVL1_23815 [Corchorus capsularis]|uniref:Uncharacterized protein n=1 Tax=Corchorus capsularis TaxID=210143 RepID=A0A1R3GS56_COCAP|nr:hypothetical protein CCACVL1_23815 [Corchorus capsularis]